MTRVSAASQSPDGVPLGQGFGGFFLSNLSPLALHLI